MDRIEKRTDWVAIVESAVLPHLESIAARVSATHGVKAHTFSNSLGRETQFRGHCVGVECLLPEVAPDQPDLIALTIVLGHLDSEPVVSAVDVCWGHPRSYCEVSVIEEPVPLSEASLADIVAQLPVLEGHLADAVGRRQPPS